ncbi:phosphatase PAP2 family protein [Streptomyces violascens]|uniref:Phosphatase PAP2 family protein n=1 Tax=Streptomyces violascens TaxID=67381 RepID=A0ABQ3R2T9_9ACTN|nr:phosphatase PAP2 family protein [Streptomyces violascens]
MAGLAFEGANPDVSLLYDINGLAKDAPSWLDRAMAFVGEYGILLGLVLVVLWCWWSVRRGEDRQSAVVSVAGIVWAPLAAGIAVLVNIPSAASWNGRGPSSTTRPGRAGRRKSDFSFRERPRHPCDGHRPPDSFVANRKFGLIALGLALLEGFCRVYMGVHYPTDVVGGFALGTAVALLLAPLAQMLLTPVVAAVARSPRLGRLVHSRKALTVVPAAAGGAVEYPESEERDLAA